MEQKFTVRALARWALGAIASLLASCAVPGSYPDPTGPRDGAGMLVDPRTGIELPGTAGGGGGGGGGGM
jgi:hypothetical protein